MATLEFAADRRETLLRQIYEVNRATIEAGKKGDPAAVLITPDTQPDPPAAYRLVDRLQIAGVKVYRADAAFSADGKNYPAGTFVVPMTQVFARYAKDLLEKQTYPEVRRVPAAPPEAPYDVTAWSLGMLLGVDVTFVKTPLPEKLALTPVPASLRRAGAVSGSGAIFAFDYTGPEGAIAINRLLKAGASITASRSTPGAGGGGTAVEVSGVPLKTMQEVAAALGLQARAMPKRPAGAATSVKAPRIGLYQPWTASMDEGWTRWVIEQYRVSVRHAAQRGREGRPAPRPVRRHSVRRPATRQHRLG